MDISRQQTALKMEDFNASFGDQLRLYGEGCHCDFVSGVVELLIAICPQIHRSILFLPCRVISTYISSEVL